MGHVIIGHPVEIEEEERMKFPPPLNLGERGKAKFYVEFRYLGDGLFCGCCMVRFKRGTRKSRGQCKYRLDDGLSPKGITTYPVQWI